MFYPQLTTLSAYSLLQSTVKIKDYVQQAKAAGYEAIGLTDHNVLYGAVEFFKACQEAQVKPIFGLLLDYVSTTDDATYQIYLFAKNYAGYQQLMRLSSEKMITETLQFSADWQTEDLFVVLPTANEFAALYTHENFAQSVQTFQHHFGQENIFYGVTNQTKPTWTEAVTWAPCAYQPVFTLDAEQTLAIDVLHHIKDGTQLEVSMAHEDTEAIHLQSATTMATQFSEEAVAQAYKIAQTCDVTLPLHQKLLPHYPLADNQAAIDYLRVLCEEQLPKRIAEPDTRYTQRLAYELQVIENMGFADYFLIIWDVMAYVHQQQIVTGAGRGSAAGSLVAYLLAITDVDPIAYDLLFERFLNPNRNTMPDIDLDIPDNRRDEVLHYVKEKYGQTNMAQIATFGTMAAKMVLRDVGRVFGISQSEANRWSKTIPNALKMTLARAYKESKNLRDLVASSQRNQQIFAVAQQLEGLPRHVSTHAAGVVIADQPLVELVPLQAGSDDIWLTQFTMNDVEAIGLLKMDFLGLRNLSIIDETLRGIRQVSEKSFGQRDIPLDDEATLRLFQGGATSGIFQFESSGIQNVLRKLGPESIEDIAAVNALYRPGPMQNIDHFIQRKKGQEAVTYVDETLQPILAETYGVIVYQEQVMQIASTMANFTLGEADILRRAMSKKNKAVLDEQRQHFVNGARANGHTEAKANEVYDYIERFADYGFNRSHAFAYSFVAFQMAYLKVHYPGPFFSALLQSVRQNPQKLKEYMNEARKRRVTILPPTINDSLFHFKLTTLQTIRYGLSSIKGVRKDLLYAILNERYENGKFTSFDQFLLRLQNVDPKWLKVDYLIPLVEVGLFDELSSNRQQLRESLEGKLQNISYSGGNVELLETMSLKEEPVADYSLEERLTLEEAYLGVYLSGHPSQKYRKIAQQKQPHEVADIAHNQVVKLLLYVKDIREIRTKKGELMAFVTGDDQTGTILVTLFPEMYRRVRGLFALQQVVYVEGRAELSKFNQEMQVIGQQIMLAQELEPQLADQTCYLRITSDLDEKIVLPKVSQILAQHRGNVPVIVFFEKTGKKRLLDEKNWLQDNETLREQLQTLLGTGNVVFS